LPGQLKHSGLTGGCALLDERHDQPEDITLRGGEDAARAVTFSRLPPVRAAVASRASRVGLRRDVSLAPRRARGTTLREARNQAPDQARRPPTCAEHIPRPSWV
jgi:hypothetical protein